MRPSMSRVLGSWGIVLVSSIGCVGGGGASGGADTGSLDVKLVDGPSADFREINLHIRKVELESSGGGWLTLATPDVTVNLLSLRSGLSQTLAAGASVPAGHYGQMRLVLAEGNTVKLADGTVAALTVPSGLESGVKVTVAFDVAPYTTKDVFIDFDGARSIQVHTTGGAAKYVLRPTVRGFDRIVTGAIAGRLIESGTGAGLGDAVVTAQEVDAAGHIDIVRTTITGADGSYTLDLLPFGSVYHVVSQPLVGTTAYQATASGSIAIGLDAPTGRFDAAVAVADATGDVACSISPAAEEGADKVSLLQGFVVDGMSFDLIVRASVAEVTDGQETCFFERVPVGSYQMVLLRGLDRVPTFTSNVAVTAGMTSQVAIAL